MSSSTNQNRYELNVVSESVTDYKKKGSVFLLRKKNSDLYLKDIENHNTQKVEFNYNNELLDKTYAGRYIDFSINPVNNKIKKVISMGKNPYSEGRGFECIYNADYNADHWYSFSGDSRIKDIYSCFTFVLILDNERKFFVLQETNDTSIYEEIDNELILFKKIENFFLYKVINKNNDIIICGSKTDIDFFLGKKYEDSVEDSIEYYKGSPTVFILKEDSGYKILQSYCNNTSVFPSICVQKRNCVDISLYEDFLHVVSLSYNSFYKKYLLTHSMGKEGGSWSYLKEILPLPLLSDIEKVDISINDNNVPYVSCLKGDNIYIRYYSYLYNEWLNFDKNSNLDFSIVENL